MPLRFLNLLMSCCILVLVLPSHGSDLKIVTRLDSKQRPQTITKYVSADHIRTEFPPSSSGWARKPGDPITYSYGHRTAVIYRCDERRVYELDLDAREYTSYELNEFGLPKGIEHTKAEPTGGTLDVSIETIDTGERKQMFGFEARRIITRTKLVPGPGAVSQPGETEQDGWFIELDVRENCQQFPGSRGGGVIVTAVRGRGETPKVDHIVVHRTGAQIEKLGFPVAVRAKSRMTLPDATSQWGPVSAVEVIELSTAPLDDAIFRVPSGFKKVRALKAGPPPPPAVQQGHWSWLNRLFGEWFR